MVGRRGSVFQWVLLFGISASFGACQSGTKKSPQDRIPAGLNHPLVALPPGSHVCREIVREGASSRKDCTYEMSGGSRTIHILALNGGSFQENAYLHGLFLANEMEAGFVGEALENVQVLGARVKNRPLRESLMRAYSCYETKMREAMSLEFLDAVEKLHKGYVAGKIAKAPESKPRFKKKDLLRATLSVEMGSFLRGRLGRFDGKIQKDVSGVDEPKDECGGRLLARMLNRPENKADRESVSASLTKMSFTSLAAVASAPWTKEGGAVHASSFEQEGKTTSWSRHSAIFLMRERVRYRYAAIGTAGLIFPGGISGMNEKGLSVSFHPVNSTLVKVEHEVGSAAMLPQLLQFALADAGTIDRAVEIIRDSEVFTGGTAFLSDSKSGEIASVEITHRRVSVARRNRNESMVQTAFFHDRLMQTHPIRNAHGLENHERLQQRESELAAYRGEMDLTTLTNLLGSVAGGSNVFSSILNPKKDPKKGKVWITLADRLPAGHGYYAGFDVDFTAMTATPVGAVRAESSIKTDLSGR